MSIQLLDRYCVQPILPCYRGNNKYPRFPKPGGRSANKCRPVNLGDSDSVTLGSTPRQSPLYRTGQQVSKQESLPGSSTLSPRLILLAPKPKPYNNAGGAVTGAPGVGGNRDVWM